MKMRKVMVGVMLFGMMVIGMIYGQPPEVEWVRNSGWDLSVGYSIQQTTDGGYILTGSSQEDPVSEPDIFLVKTDSIGVRQWHREFGDVYSYEWGRSVQQTVDGGYVIAAVGDMDLIKTNDLGYILWARSFGEPPYGMGAYDVRQTSDGGFIVAGSHSFSGSSVFYLVKTDSVGDTLWTRCYGRLEENHAYSVRQTTDGGYIVLGRTGMEDPYYDVFLVKTDSVGDTMWTHTYGGPENEWVYSIQQTSDGGYILVGASASFGAYSCSIYMIKTNSAGDTLWTRCYGGEPYKYAYSILQTSDGGYLLAGKIWLETRYGAYFVRTDDLGETLWTLIYSEEYFTGGLIEVQQTSDQGYIAVGDIFYDEFNWLAWLVKVGPDTFTYHPEIQISDSALDLGMVPVTEDSSQELIVYNTGNGWLHVHEVIAGDSSFVTDFGCLDSLIAPHDSLVIMVTFAPSDTIQYNDTLRIFNNDEPKEVLLTGIGTPPDPEIVVSDSLLDFGDVIVGEDSSLGLIIYNTGNTRLIIYDISASDSSFYTDFELSDSLIAPGDSLEITVTFSPADTFVYHDTLRIENNDELVEVVLQGVGLPTSGIVSESLPKMPTVFALGDIYPNPCNTQAVIRYDVPVAGDVKMVVYDVLGRKVARLVDGDVNAGRYRAVWDGGNLTSGIYFVRMKAGEFVVTRKVVLLK